MWRSILKMPTLALWLIYFLGASEHSIRGDDVTPIYQSYLDDSGAGREPMLPDFSYAGYQRGEKPIPLVKGPIFDVTHYGAVPNSSKPAFEGIQNAINACEEAGGGVVWFPKGLYQVNPKPSEATQPRLRIQKSGVVLRGEGSGKDGSILFMEAEIQPEDPMKMWSGRPALLVAPLKNQNSTQVGEVNGAVAMNQKLIPVKLGHKMKPDDRIAIINKVSADLCDALNERIAPHTWEPQWTWGLRIHEKHEIESVGKDYIILKEGLLTPIKANQVWTLNTIGYINNIGIENLCFRGNWHEVFVHHKDWRHDSGWRGIKMTNTENSWIRNCVFEAMNWPIQITISRNSTMENITFTGVEGHFGIQCSDATNILNLNIRDEAGHWHGHSLQSGSCGIVYHGGIWKVNGSLDSHARNPYANLFECNKGGLTLQGCGGAREDFPHHLHACVIWNHVQTAKFNSPVDFWPEHKIRYHASFANPILVGVTGIALDYRNSSVMESVGKQVAPRSLWLAQLKQRLGAVPMHFKKYE